MRVAAVDASTSVQLKYILCCIYVVIFNAMTSAKSDVISPSVLPYDAHLRGPSFVMEPPPKLEFSNSSGGYLDCSATGSPQPSIEWQTVDGSSVGDVSGIRRVLRNGTLLLLPFPAAAYRQDIHNTVYRCMSSNSLGRIITRDVQVRAVVAQAYKVEVEVLSASRGCTAILQCVVPSFVKELVRVVSWVQEPAFHIYPSLQGDGKYHLLPTGELLIHNLDYTDRYATYRCRTMHRLTRQVVVSSSAKIRMNDPKGIVTPTIVEYTSHVSVAQDEGAVLLCIAQGCPALDYSWYTLSGSNEPLPVLSSSRVRLLGPILAIEAVTSEDAGSYKCAVANAGGEANAELRLTVSTPVHVEIMPNVLSVNMGATAEFRCVVSSNGMPMTSHHHITWIKDGRQLPISGQMGNTLLVTSVGREDKGMYQCMVRRQEGDTFQAVAELQLGDASPVLLYSFIEQTLQPGPAVSLKCSAAGNPTPQITWTLDGFPLPINGRFIIGQYVTVHGDVISHVNITHVMVEDGGEYSCRAENRAGQSTHSARLNIYGSPYIRLIPKVTAVAGESLHLKCPVAGYPIEEIHWERGGRELPDDIRQKVQPDGLLIISPVQKAADSGVYTCWARNKQGHSARRSGEVTVIVPPMLSSFHTPIVQLNVGDRASFSCSVVKGDLPLTINWKKDGRLIDQGPHRMSATQVDQFNSMLVVDSLNSDHTGNYSCVVKNLAAEVQISQSLLVNVPPTIEPFSFQDDLAEGMRTRLICGVSRGDAPINLRWLKDGEPFPPVLAANITLLDQYSSLLSILSLTAAHTGDYTCVATNSASEMRYTANLQVKVPPNWIIEPTDVNVERNRNIMLHCQAKGVPSPVVVWKRTTGGKSGDYEEIREQPYTKILSNGSLYMQNVKEDREGFYLCQAKNGIGMGIGKVIQLKVNSPPYFSAQNRMVQVKKGDIAILQCEVNGDVPIEIMWLKAGKNELNPSTNYRVSLKQDSIPDGVAAEAQITNVDSSDSGPYFCQARNAFGRDQQLIQLQVQEPPSPPSSLEAVTVSSRSVNLKWQSRGTLDLNEVVRYIVEYRELDRQWDQMELNETPQYTALIENLKPATRYAFRVVAVGSAGKSMPSQELIIKTDPQRPNGPPLNLSARPMSSSEVLVTWSPPLAETKNGEILGYNIGYKSALSSSNSYNFTTFSGNGEDGTGELLLTELSKFHRYTITVQAFNQIGPGPLAEPISVQTLEDVPGQPPEDVRCASLTSESLQISWQPPPTQFMNGLLQGYKLFFEPVSEHWSEEVETRKTTSQTTVLNHLKKYTNYSIQVLAFTRMGDGVESQPTFCHTEEDVPDPPIDIKVVVSSPTALFVSWIPPSQPHGIITKYNVYVRTGNGRDDKNTDKKSIPSQQLQFEVKGLQAFTEYQFWVTAVTRVGEGKPSRIVTQVTSNRIPARIISFGGTLVKPWRSPAILHCSSVGQPKREWFKSDNLMHQGAIHNAQITEAGELMFSSLQVHDNGNYSCQVENGVGTDKITYNLVVQVPPAAPVLYVTSATSSSILIHWKSGNSGNAPITGYSLHYKPTHGNMDELRLSRHTTSQELKGLVCGTTYQLYLIAYNKIAPSSPSTSINVRTQGQSPGVPSTTTLLKPNSTSVNLNLYSWPDNGCPIMFFVLKYRSISESDDSEWILVSNALKPQRRFTITSLKSTTLYQLKMEAHNVAGVADADFTFVTMTKDGDLPPPDLIQRSQNNNVAMLDMKAAIVIIVLISSTICIVSIIIICYKQRQNQRLRKEAMESQQNADAVARERYYATIHKGAGFRDVCEKIPETSEDISPYATFQLSEASTLAQTHHLAPTNTLLHSFMYHERAMTEGCASPPTAAAIHNKKRRHSRKTADSEESDSDPDQITSSRTESSNHHEAKLKHVGSAYHGTQSSTSSDLSPISDQKSLPRHSRSRGETMRSLLALQIPEHVAGGAGGFHMAHHHVPIDGAGSAVGNEYMESDADLLDKKRDKQLRQAPSMWARPKMVGIITNDKHKSSLKKPIPKGGGLGTDFSIAV